LASPGVEAQPDPRRWVFGFGRRVSHLSLLRSLIPTNIFDQVCPGQYFTIHFLLDSLNHTAQLWLGAYFAEISIFLSVAGVLSAFDISKHVDKDGQEVEPDISFSTNITSFVQHSVLYADVD
jgi:hypothetical protein